MRILLTLLTALVFCTATAHAQNRAQVAVPFSGEPKLAVGVILSAKGTRQETKTKVTRRDDNSVVVTFPFTASDRSAAALASAFVVGDGDVITFGDVVSLSTEDPDNAYIEIPACQEQIELPALASEQLGNLEKLVEIRTQRRAVLQTKITRLMQGPVLEKLRKLERGFGISNGDEIRPDMHPLELIDRLSRLKQAISSYEANKKKS